MGDVGHELAFRIQKQDICERVDLHKLIAKFNMMISENNITCRLRLSKKILEAVIKSRILVY